MLPKHEYGFGRSNGGGGADGRRKVGGRRDDGKCLEDLSGGDRSPPV